jgi:nucleotide-binding universal stress UspA family protein
VTTAPRVLAAVDFSDASARAVAIAGFISQACRGRLTLLHAESVDAPLYFTSEQLDPLERERQTSRAAAQAAVAQFGREHTPMSFSVEVIEQPPVDAIVEASATADLIVIGTHGRHGPARWWLGSVTERAMHEVLKPLLVVRSELPDPIETLFARMVVLAESGSSGAHALEYARALAARCQGTVFDERGATIDQALERTRATFAIVAAPHPGSAQWTGRFAELLVRGCAVPLLFIPELAEGGAS